MEEALRESEARYRAIVEDQTELVCRFTPDCIITFVNQACCSYFGKKQKKLIGSNFLELIPETDRENIEQSLKSLSKSKPILTIAHRIIANKEKIRWVKCTHRGIIDEQGRLIEYQSVGRDITDQVQTEAALKESQARYGLATQSGQVGVWDWDIKTGEIFVDPNLKAMLGYEDHEIRNHLDDWGKLVHPGDAEQVMVEANKHLEGSTPRYEIAHRMLHKDGTIRWFLARGEAMRDKNGNPYRVLGTDTNITKIMLLEEKLSKAHDNLEKQVQERTAELLSTNEKLRKEIKERKLAESALREREVELENKSINLQEVNTALKVLLKKRAEDKKEIEEKMLLNIEELIIPFFEKLKNSTLNKKQKAYIDIINSNLNEIISPLARGLSSNYLKLTSTEIQIANLIKQDKTTKEIAALLNLATRTIESYRDNIRNKLGIKHKKVNLKTYLLSIE
ncbi:MAG: PAS domain-containing protein [Desulfobacterales bacterium]